MKRQKLTKVSSGKDAVLHFDLTGYTPDTYYFHVLYEVTAANGEKLSRDASGIYHRFTYTLQNAPKGTLKVDIYDTSNSGPRIRCIPHRFRSYKTTQMKRADDPIDHLLCSSPSLDSLPASLQGRNKIHHPLCGCASIVILSKKHSQICFLNDCLGINASMVIGELSKDVTLSKARFHLDLQSKYYTRILRSKISALRREFSNKGL